MDVLVQCLGRCVVCGVGGCCCCLLQGNGPPAVKIVKNDAANATMVVTATYHNYREVERPALPLSPEKPVMFRGAYYVGGPAVPSEVLDAIAADEAFTKDYKPLSLCHFPCEPPVACCGKPCYSPPAEVADADALKELRARYPCHAFEAEPRWVSHKAPLDAGYCGRRSQWATVLTITASADARSPTSVTTMTTEERAREARTERERALRAELDRARLGEE